MRLLLISDCDEVLFYMVKYFGVWFDEVYDIDFWIEYGDFVQSMMCWDGGLVLICEDMWIMLG